MLFFVGIPNPHNAWRVPRAFVSINTLVGRKGDFRANDWVMDSGAFTQVTMHGNFTMSVGEYAERVVRWSACGNMLAAVSQDFMCEPPALEKTGGTVEDHQRWTVERYLSLRELVNGVAIMPVLQGQAPADYIQHITAYGESLVRCAWVGVGSVCKRNGGPSEIVDVLSAIKSVRPDLRLHGFGIRVTSLADARIRDRLYSADSMSWSFAARKAGLPSNHPIFAEAFARRIDAQAVQKHLFDGGQDD